MTTPAWHSCGPVDLEIAIEGSWGCCACWKKGGAATFNGPQRRECKGCGHARCDRAAPPKPKAAELVRDGVNVVRNVVSFLDKVCDALPDDGRGPPLKR